MAKTYQLVSLTPTTIAALDLIKETQGLSSRDAAVQFLLSKVEQEIKLTKEN